MAHKSRNLVTICYFVLLGEWTNGSNILGLVTFAIFFGIALANMGEKAKPLLDFFSCLREVDSCLRLTSCPSYTVY